MEPERMKQIILNIYGGQVNMTDVHEMLAEYMVATRGSVNQALLQYLTETQDPIRMQMLQSAVEVCKTYFEATYGCITKVYDKNNQLLKVF